MKKIKLNDRLSKKIKNLKRRRPWIRRVSVDFEKGPDGKIKTKLMAASNLKSYFVKDKSFSIETSVKKAFERLERLLLKEKSF